METPTPIMKLFMNELMNIRDNHLLASQDQSIFSMTFDTKKWDYRQLVNIDGFGWEEGVTPLSNLGVIFYTWIAYFVVILSLKFVMQYREPFKLKYITAVHNLVLCLGSLAIFLPGMVVLFVGVAKLGTKCYCFDDYELKKGLGTYCMYVFYLSKFYELLDTVILVLKKKPVIFLHWYHHSIVVLTCWAWLHYKVSFGIAPMLLNTFVHVFMYYYYFAAGLGYNVWYRQYITMLQIAQFSALGVLALCYVYYANQNQCNEWVAFNFSVVVNVTFFLLFCQFYVSAYLKKGKKTQAVPKKTERVIDRGRKVKTL